MSKLHNEVCSTKQKTLHSSGIRALSSAPEEKDGPLCLLFFSSLIIEPFLWFETQQMLWKKKLFWILSLSPYKWTLYRFPNRRKLFMHKKNQTVQFSHSQCRKWQHSRHTLIRPLKERERALLCTRGVGGSRPGVWVRDCLLN